MPIEMPRLCVKHEILKLKPCQFPECQEYYMGTGFSRYCKEHRKREYRKVIDHINHKKRIKENPNQHYQHCLTKPEIIQFNCPTCGILFNIKIFPNINVYPKYCEEHRNEWKRKLYNHLNKKHVPIIPEHEIVINKVPDLIIPDTVIEQVVLDTENIMEFEEDSEIIESKDK